MPPSHKPFDYAQSGPRMRELTEQPSDNPNHSTGGDGIHSLDSHHNESGSQPQSVTHALTVDRDLEPIEFDHSATDVEAFAELAQGLVDGHQLGRKRPTEQGSSGKKKAKVSDYIRANTKARRAFKACEVCRKQKTRCFPCPDSLACLRCHTLALPCSLQQVDGIGDGQGSYGEVIPASHRLDRLESTVGEILSILRKNVKEASSASEKVAPLTGASRAAAAVAQIQDREDELSQTRDISLPTEKPRIFGEDERPVPRRPAKDLGERPVTRRDILDPLRQDCTSSFGMPCLSFQLSPYSIYSTVSGSANYPPPLSRLLDPQMVVQDQDIISLGLITEREALELLEYFRDNYNRWVSFPEEIEIKTLLDRIRKRCSLLLSVCCCVVIRYYNNDIFNARYKLLLRKMQNELTQSLTVVPQTIEFMQALALVAIYAASLSDGDIVFDGWFYSSVALQHFITKDILGLVMSFDGIGPVTEFDEITAYRVWNHLCLVHLVSCALSGRMCILDELRLDQCRRTLSLPSATNFDGRMVAEISLQLLVYNFVETPQSFEEVKEDMKEWLDEWGYLFEQPTIQFVESGYHFGYFSILLHWSQLKYLANNGTDRDREQASGPDPLYSLRHDDLMQVVDSATVQQMVGHLQKVIDCLLVVKSNTYFSCLSDQVFFHGAYSAIMLGKIIRGLQVCGRIAEFSKAFVQMLRSKISRLATRFRTIAMSPGDLSIKYSNAIMDSIGGR